MANFLKKSAFCTCGHRKLHFLKLTQLGASLEIVSIGIGVKKSGISQVWFLGLDVKFKDKQ